MNFNKLLIFIFSEASAGVASGKVKSFYINQSGLVLLALEHDNYQCNGGIWPLIFSLDGLAAKEWISMILMAEATDKELKVAYSDNPNGRCSVSYVYFLK